MVSPNERPFFFKDDILPHVRQSPVCFHATFDHPNAISPIPKFILAESRDVWWNGSFTLCSSKKEESSNEANKMILLYFEPSIR